MIYLFLNSFFISLFGIIFWSILTRMIPTNDYGYLSYIFSLSLLFSNLFSLGIFAGVWKFYSIGKGKEIFVFSSILISLILIFVFLISFTIFNNLYLAILSASMILSQYLESILYGRQKMREIFISNFLSSFFKLLLLFLLIFYFGVNVTSILVAILASLIVAIIVKTSFSKNLLYFTTNFSFAISKIKDFLSFSFSSFSSTIFNILYSNFLVVFSFLVISPIISAVLFFSQQVSAFLNFIPSIIVGAALPILSKYATKMDANRRKISFIIDQILKLLVIIVITLAFLISFNMNEFFEVIGSKEEFKNFSFPFFLIITISSLFIIISNFLNSFLYSINRIKEIYLIETFSIIIFSVFILILFYYNDILIFLLLYFLTAFIRFVFYSYSLQKNVQINNIYYNLKLLVYVGLTFIFSYLLFLNFSGIHLTAISIVIYIALCISLIKFLKIFDEQSKKFIKMLKLPKFLENLIVKII
ncbi:MAG: lipopolysaccharide biosynthesis protein [Candidatus Aenigmatarchaeota archaeon]